MTQLQVGSTANLTLMVRDMEVREAKNHNKFLWGTLFNKESTYAACMWNEHLVTEGLKPGDVIRAKFDVKEFNGTVQLDVKDGSHFGITPIEGVPDLSLFIRISAITQEVFMAYYNEQVRHLIEDESIEKLLDQILETDSYWRAPAAQGMHQHWVGGLGEHVHRLLRLFVGMIHSDHPTVVNCRKSLVIAGLVLHDWLKTKDYEEVSPGVFQYTEFCNLVGHPAGGPIVVSNVINKQRIKMDPRLRMHLYHVMLAHHGRRDWGSPIEPATIEAWIVHMLDNLDGKLSMFEETKDGGYHKGIGRIHHFVVNT